MLQTETASVARPLGLCDLWSADAVPGSRRRGRDKQDQEPSNQMGLGIWKSVSSPVRR